MAKDKYVDLAGHPAVRVRVESLYGNPHVAREGMWWDQEEIVFMTAAGPFVSSIVEAETKVLEAIRAQGLDVGTRRAEVVMFHGTFVKIIISCPPGTATRLGIKGYTR